MLPPVIHSPGRSTLALGCFVAVVLMTVEARAQTATALRFVQEPTDVAVGKHIDPPVTVAAVDASGTRVTSYTQRIQVDLLSNPGDASLGGRKQDDPRDGLATFDNLSVSEPGEGYTLRATSGGLTSATSATFDVGDDDDDDEDDDDDAAVRLEFDQQPTSTVAGATITPVTVRALDADGGIDTSFVGSVTIATATGPSSGELQGSLVRAAVNGVATFDDLSLAVAGIYSLIATSGGLASGTSAPFTIAPGPPSGATSEITADPSSIPADGSSGSTITVRLLDEFGNPLGGGGNAVVLSTDRGVLTAVSDQGDGTYAATLVASTSPGTATVTGTVDGGSIDDTAIVEFTQVDSPPPSPSPSPSPANSLISADPVSIVADGSSTATITVVLIGADGVPLAAGGDQVTLETNLGTLGPVTDRRNGVHTATLTSGTSPGTATVTGTVNGEAIVDTATVTFAAGSADVEVEVSVSDEAPRIGDDLALVVTVRNGGPGPATGIQLSQGVPPRLALASATPSKGDYDPATGIWSVGSLAPDERATLTLVLTVVEDGS